MLLEAHHIRVGRGDYNITEVHLADAIEQLTLRDRQSLSIDRAPRNPYAKPVRSTTDRTAEPAGKKRTLGKVMAAAAKPSSRKKK